MIVKLWGTRGSIATPLTTQQIHDRLKASLELWKLEPESNSLDIDEFIDNLPPHISKYTGGNTTCVEVDTGENPVIFDAGTGIRALGIDLLKRHQHKQLEAHILMTHTHWDHISGFPFFAPAYIPNNRIHIYGAHDRMEHRFSQQQNADHFPVSISVMPAEIFFHQLKKHDHFSIQNSSLQVFPLNHPGGCYSYRLTNKGKSICFATDSEYKDLSFDSLKPYVTFFKDADLLIFDAQFTLVENIEKEDWGHSNVFAGIDIALLAGVKRLVFTHHEPTYDDKKLWEIFEQAKKYLSVQTGSTDLELYLALEGETFEI